MYTLNTVAKKYCNPLDRKVFIFSAIFRDKDHTGLHQLFRDSAREIYDKAISLDADAYSIPDDYYMALSEATESAGDRHYVELYPQHLLYLFEIYNTSQVGGVNIPYACMQ